MSESAVLDPVEAGPEVEVSNEATTTEQATSVVDDATEATAAAPLEQHTDVSLAASEREYMDRIREVQQHCVRSRPN